MKKIFKQIDRGVNTSMQAVVDEARSKKKKIVVEKDGEIVYISPKKAEGLLNDRIKKQNLLHKG